MRGGFSYFFHTFMAVKFDTVSARARLVPRRDPYWQRISKGRYLGYRKMTSAGEGTWSARTLDAGSGKQLRKPLGDFSTLPDHQRADAALKAAQAWFDHLDKGGSTIVTTVRAACSRYVEHLHQTKTARAADDAEARFKNYVLNDLKLAATDLSKLLPAHIESWRKALRDAPTRSGPNRGKKRSDSTLNRDMTCFRAALNLAFSDGLVSTDFAWRRKLLPLKNADRRREVYLDLAQRRRLIECAAPDLALFLRGLALLPLRPGAIAALNTGDFDRRLNVLKIGKDKQGQDRKIKLPDQTAELFAEAAHNKLPGAPLLSRSDGQAWNKDAWKWSVKAAAETACMPHGTTAYTLRHSVISDLVHDGLDLLTVAQISGTSVAMIEKHYGHLRSDIAAGALARLAW